MSKVNQTKVIELEKNNLILNQRIGEQTATVGKLREEITELKKEQKRKEEDLKQRLEKEVKIVDETKLTKQCPNCGRYLNPNEIKAGLCIGCGYSFKGSNVQYKNLDDVVGDIKKDVTKQLKKDIALIEDEKESLELDLTKATRSIKRLEKQLEEDVQAAKEKSRKTLNKIIKEKENEIDELREEIVKVKEDKTDDQIEEARKQEIIDLKEYIRTIEKERNMILESLPKFLRKRYENAKAKHEAHVDVAEKERAAERVSNSYPRVKKVNKFGVWYESFKTTTNSWWDMAASSITDTWGRF